MCNVLSELNSDMEKILVKRLVVTILVTLTIKVAKIDKVVNKKTGVISSQLLVINQQWRLIVV